jgi:protein-S-isoprenylcysteine O-methyltransferase Ste14
MKDKRPLTFAGLWENWKDRESGEWLRTCAIILMTGGSNELVAQIHPRMPVILPEQAALTMPGVCFAVWARSHLGKYWSGRITLKEDHRVIQTGPYAWVRHPIYSGLLLALLGTVLTVGTLQACLGFARSSFRSGGN